MPEQKKPYPRTSTPPAKRPGWTNDTSGTMVPMMELLAGLDPETAHEILEAHQRLFGSGARMEFDLLAPKRGKTTDDMAFEMRPRGEGYGKDIALSPPKQKKPR